MDVGWEDEREARRAHKLHVRGKAEARLRQHKDDDRYAASEHTQNNVILRSHADALQGYCLFVRLVIGPTYARPGGQQ